MHKETACVYCRLKPSSKEITERCIKYENQYTICTVPPKDCNRNSKEMTFNFTKVFHNETTQSEIYNDIAYPLVNDLLNGKNGLLFAYGVTGSGKTYTMEGTRENPGIVPRTIKSMFRRLKFLTRFRIQPNGSNGYHVCNNLESLLTVLSRREDYSRISGNYECKEYMNRIEDDPFEMIKTENCTVFVTMIEIYGKMIRDLLINESDKNNNNVRIKEDCKNQYYLNNVTEVEVQTAEEALYWYLKGQKNRKTAQTNLNNQSSRSHCVFNIRLVRLNQEIEYSYSSPDITQSDENVVFKQLSLVDLAGNERAKRTGATGTELREAGDINNSLMDLQKIMKTLRDNQKYIGDNNNNKFINYRANELTKLFKTNFEDGSSVKMILCVQQLPEEYNETLRLFSFMKVKKEFPIGINSNYYFDHFKKSNDLKSKTNQSEIRMNRQFPNMGNTFCTNEINSSEIVDKVENFTNCDMDEVMEYRKMKNLNDVLSFKLNTNCVTSMIQGSQKFQSVSTKVTNDFPKIQPALPPVNKRIPFFNHRSKSQGNCHENKGDSENQKKFFVKKRGFSKKVKFDEHQISGVSDKEENSQRKKRIISKLSRFVNFIKRSF